MNELPPIFVAPRAVSAASDVELWQVEHEELGRAAARLTGPALRRDQEGLVVEARYPHRRDGAVRRRRRQRLHLSPFHRVVPRAVPVRLRLVQPEFGGPERTRLLDGVGADAEFLRRGEKCARDERADDHDGEHRHREREAAASGGSARHERFS